MKLSIATFCLICIISSAATEQLPFEGSENRNFNPLFQIDYFDVLSANAILQEKVSENDKNNPEDHVLHSSENVKTNFKRHQDHYNGDYYSRLNRNENDTKKDGAKVFRTYGKGKAQVTRQGQTVNVPNEYGRNVYRGAVAENGLDKNENEMRPTRQRVCRECPTDQTVVVSKGNTFSILPEPCPLNPRMWNHYSGPRPGSKIREGVHTIRGYIGSKKKFCQYNYQVLVRNCNPLNGNEDTVIECSAEYSWGSICNVTCTNEKEPLGPTQLECKEDLKWSNPIPSCKSKTDCSTPKVKAKSKISCQTADMLEVEGDFLPNGSTCKFWQNEKLVSINCKDGKWRIIRKSKSNSTKKSKQESKNKQPKKDLCNPNPCQNGGTCLRPESNTGSPICKCRPQTRGVNCEMRECYYNICENDGICFFQNEERVCYCTPEYSGNTCQHYKPQ